MGFTCHVVLIETSGNQGYIFDTTKRRENVGASQLIFTLEDRWVEDALPLVFPGFEVGWRITDGRPAQKLVAAAGGVKLAVRDPELGKALVTEVTARALRDAPGLDVHGVVGEPFDWDAGYEADGVPAVSMLARRCREAHGLLPFAKTARPGSVSRFPRIPIADECAASGLPAFDVVEEGTGRRARQPRSRPSLAKRRAQDAGFERLARDARLTRAELEAVADHLEGKQGWVAVIHADGNNLGQLFTGLASAEGDASSDRYADLLGPVSKAVDDCTRAAFHAALDHVRRIMPRGVYVRVAGREILPVLPLVLGGDDLTVICDGAIALPFTEAYLVAFEEATRRHGDVSASAPGGLTACAGVAVVKSHFPFSAAYDLAEELTGEAKRTVKAYAPSPGASALSFHVLYDSGGSDPKHLRARMTVPGARLHAQPYVVTRGLDEPWTRGRHWDDLLRRVAALSDTFDGTEAVSGDAGREAGERKLPASQMHELREALFHGRAVADSRFRQKLLHYRDRGLMLFAGDGLADVDAASLFWQIRAPGLTGGGLVDGAEPPVTGLLDAMNAVGLMGDLPHRHNDIERARAAAEGVPA